VDFLLQAVQENENRVTILALGAATNIAKACMEDESFAAKTAGIVYMGTMLEDTGSYTPYADFPCQTVIPHDAIAAAVFLNPSLIEEKRILSLDVNTDAASPQYGQVTGAEAEEGIQVILSVKTDLYWDFVTDLLTRE
jgi:inosine-uridine nucleoside N-ribohydrolase